MSKVRITQVKSLIGRPKDQRGTVKALGLKRINHSVEQNDTPEIRGMINKVSHLISIEQTKTLRQDAKKVKEEKSEDKVETS